jgi:hypothetical protein
MPDDKENLFGETGDEAVDDFDRLIEILFQRVIAFAEEEELADELLSPLLLRLSLTSRMVAYAANAANPPAADSNSISTGFAATSRTSFAK